MWVIVLMFDMIDGIELSMVVYMIGVFEFVVCELIGMVLD